MAKSAFLPWLHLGGRSLRLGMIEIEVSPPPGVGITLRVLDGHIRAIERPREIPSSRRLLSRAIRVFSGQRELQLLEHDCAFGKYFRLLVDLVCSRLHVDIVIFGEAGLAIVERIGGQRRSDINPFMEVLGQNQLTGCGVLRRISLSMLRQTSLFGDCRCCNGGAHHECKCYRWSSIRHVLSPSTECRSTVRRYYESRGGTFEKRGPSPSAMVGCARTASRRFVYGRPARIAVCTTAMASPASAPIIVKPRMRSSRAATSAFIKPCRSSIVCVRSTAFIGSFATRTSA